jgi:hypothetical protein
MNIVPPRTFDKSAAAGPIEIKRYKAGKLVEEVTLPAPGDVEFREKFIKAGRPPKALVEDRSKRGKAAQKYDSNPF